MNARYQSRSNFLPWLNSTLTLILSHHQHFRSIAPSLLSMNRCFSHKCLKIIKKNFIIETATLRFQPHGNSDLFTKKLYINQRSSMNYFNPRGRGIAGDMKDFFNLNGINLLKIFRGIRWNIYFTQMMKSPSFTRVIKKFMTAS